MTAYNFSLTYPDSQQPTRWAPGELVDVVFEYSLSGALASADTITTPSGALPSAGIRIYDVEISYPELDSNASPTGTLNVGDSGNAARFISGALMGRADGGVIYTPINVAQTLSSGEVATGTNYYYVPGTDPRLVMTVASAVATGVTSGYIRMKVSYYCAG